MISKSKGVVLRHIKYKETSLIVDIFTREFGLTSFIVNNVRTRRPSFPISLFQPLNILDLVVYLKNNDGLQRFSEAKNNPVYKSIYKDFKKSTIILFLSEVLFKSMKHESHPENVYDFIESSLIHFDLQKIAVSEFHLKFLLRLTQFLGFSPGDSNTLMNQLLQQDSIYEEKIDLLIHKDYNELVIENYEDRIKILDHIIDFYVLHIDSFGEIKSFKILHTILAE